MFFLEAASSAPALVYSATDLVVAAQCEFSILHTLDQKLGRIPRQEPLPDPQRERAAALGEAHEARVLAALKEKYGPWRPEEGAGLYEVEPPSTYSREALEEKYRETVGVLAQGADVVFQASFFDGEFHGRADFVVRQENGMYRVVDTKLARTARVTALLQLAAYARQLELAGIPVDRQASLILGSGVESLHDLSTITPVFEEKRERLLHLLGLQGAAGAQAVEWKQDPAYAELTRCGECDDCRRQVLEHRDMLLTAGMTARVRSALVERYGWTGLDDLAELADSPELPAAFRRYAEQAALQTGRAVPHGSASFKDASGQEQTVSYRLLPRHSLGLLPRAAAGDLFIALRQDGLWQDTRGPVSEKSWGLAYLLGMTGYPEEPGGQAPSQVLWAHSRAEERRLLLDFLGRVHSARTASPGLHIYHFGAQVKNVLRELAARHNVGEDYLADLLQEGVLVDLSEVVRKSMRVSSGARRLADVEALYMGGQRRPFEIPAGAYTDLCVARQTGDAPRVAAVEGALAGDAAFDGVSLLVLRDWLLGLAGRSAGAELAEPVPLVDVQEILAQAGKDEQEGPAERDLRLFVEALDVEGALEGTKQAIAMVAAATGYHRRERRQFWWEHFDRLTAPVEDWEQTRDVLVLERVTVRQDWHRAERARGLSRVLEGYARLAPGSSVKVGSQGLFAMYGRPLPDFLEQEARRQALVYAALHEGVLPAPAERAGAFSCEVLALEEVEGREGWVRFALRESLKSFEGEDAVPYSQLPMAITPGMPIPTRAQEQALAELAAATAQVLPQLPPSAGTDVLVRAEPRLVGGDGLPRPADFVESHGQMATVEAIYRAVANLDGSYVAVQGPPGSGKTFVGSHVIGRLVQAGAKVGIVAQSHAVVENILAGCIKNGGVDPERIAKGSGKSQTPDFPWQEVANADVSRFMASPGGRIFGGTAWDFASDRKFRAGSLDLLVIDEAGQYSLANMLAVARSARNLLLLGDPAQLPQVTQGVHPAPVDESALGWLAAGRTVLPESHGFFLDVSWRMHPALCGPVSELSYEGRLGSAPAGSERSLAGWEPGVYVSEVEHRGNSTFSVEEAAEVVRLARSFVGAEWTAGAGAVPRPLVAEDVIVVAAYNAQVETIRLALVEAGLAGGDGSGVRVGTVDKFQGQEAPVVLVSMAASSVGDSPRGAEFLLSAHRLNVALSRGMWAAVVVRSRRFTHFLPSSPEVLGQLGGFVRLCRGALALPGEAG